MTIVADQLDTFKEAIKILIETEYPELLSPARHMMQAIVIEVKGAVCDLQPLAAGGIPHPLLPPLPNVTIPIGATIGAGKRVRIGFYYADPSHPYIDEVIGDA